MARVRDESRSKIMASIKRRDTKPELLLRKELWRRGLRGYRLDVKLPGRPDIFFSKYKLCVFVDGCFWHGCPIHYKGVERNKGYWDAKIRPREVISRGEPCQTRIHFAIMPTNPRKAWITR